MPDWRIIMRDGQEFIDGSEGSWRATVAEIELVAEADRLRAENEALGQGVEELRADVNRLSAEAWCPTCGGTGKGSDPAEGTQIELPHSCPDCNGTGGWRADYDRLQAENEKLRADLEASGSIRNEWSEIAARLHAQRDARPDLTPAETEALAYPLRTGPTLDEARLTGMDKLRALLDEGDEIEVRGPA